MSTYEMSDVPLFNPWDAEKSQLHGVTWLCVQQNCDGIHHWYQNPSDIT